MTFLNIMDFKSKIGVDVNDYLHLRVDQSKGIDTIPDMDINITDLNKSGNTLYKQFFNNGYGGITFKATIIIKKTDKWNKKAVKDVLHKWFINMSPIAVVTDAMDVPNGQYIISKNPTRKQTFIDSTVWELEFTTYTQLKLYKYKNYNSAVLKALQKAKKGQKSQKKKATVNVNLSKCNYKVLVYSKNKKNVKCVKYMQKILYKNKLLKKKQIDGWYGKKTKKAVKRFQKKYNRTHKKTINVKSGQKLPTGKKYLSKRLDVTGKVDKATWKALCNA